MKNQATEAETSIGRVDMGGRQVRAWLHANSIWVMTAVLVAFFSVQSEFFLTSYNISNVLTQATLIGFLALGLTPLIISGNIDLSVGSVAALAACLVVLLEPYGPAVAIGAAIASGIVVGLVNGFLVEGMGINSFIVSLAMMSGVRGLTFLLVGDVSLSASDMRYNIVATTMIGPVSTVVIVFTVLAVGIGLVLKRTSYGRNTYAIGGNRDAAVDAGIPVSRDVTISFVVAGVMSACCGISMAANLGAAAPSFATGYELIAIAAVILGGTRLSGGHGFIAGTIAAVLALAILQNGLNLIGTSPFIVPVILGVVLVGALVLDRQLQSKKTEVRQS